MVYVALPPQRPAIVQTIKRHRSGFYGGASPAAACAIYQALDTAGRVAFLNAGGGRFLPVTCL